MTYLPSMLRTLLLALAIPCLGAATSAPKAEASLLYAGERVRLSIATPELIRVLSGAPLPEGELRRSQIVGILHGRQDDDIVISLQSSGSSLAVPVRSITRLETSRGRHGRTGRGALIGFGAGLVGGVAAGLIVCSSGDCDDTGSLEITTGLVSTMLGLGGAIVGTGVGALTGSLIRSERWQTVTIQEVPKK
jgi:hypothetical protein